MLLYGDKQHYLLLESIIDKLSRPNLFTEAIKQFHDVIERTEQSRHLLNLITYFNHLSKIDDHAAYYYSNTSIFTQLNCIKYLIKSLINY
jgi:hypothetical protein